MRISLVALVKAPYAKGSPQQLACSPQNHLCDCRHGKDFLCQGLCIKESGTVGCDDLLGCRR